MKKSVLAVVSLVLSIVFAFAPVTSFAEGAVAPFALPASGNSVMPLANAEDYTITTIQTSTGRNVTVGIYNKTDFNSEQQSAYHNQVLGIFGYNVYLLSGATNYYNCHSYAWYSQNYTSNYYWMDDPTPYFSNPTTNLHTHEESNGSVGDIIVYFNHLNIPIHSGIVVKTLSGTSNNIVGDADLKIVQSKWGATGLYTHRGDTCPYTSQYETRPYYYASYVKYYRLKNHEHSWNTHFYADFWDEIYCSTCSLTMYHELSYTYDNTSHYSNCSFCGVVQGDFHQCSSYTDSGDGIYHTGTCSVCNAQIIKSHACTAYSPSTLSGYHQGTCTVCSGTAYEEHEWVKLGNKYRCTVCNHISTNISLMENEEDYVCIEE